MGQPGNVCKRTKYPDHDCYSNSGLFAGKSRFLLNDTVGVQIGKIMNKLGFEYVKKGNQHYYILRIVDAESVEKESYPPMK